MTVSHGAVALTRSVGDQLRRLREQTDLTQAMLAARLQAAGMDKGSSAKTVSAWERGETPLPLMAIWYLAEAFRMEPATLARRLGICGPTDLQTTYIAEGADILASLQDEPPDIVAMLVTSFRQSVDIARAARLARNN